jgi:hypothetical protein
LIWIVCAEALKRKFREAAVRDGNANKISGDIEQKEKEHKSVDLLILTKAKDYGFIDEVAFQKLKYIYTMRCIYGHPYESAPDDAELTAAAAVVVNEVLGKPTLLKHGFVQTLIDKLFSDVNYLEQSEASVRSFAREINARIAPAVYGYVVETYAKKLEPSYDDPSLEVIVERGLWFLSEFLLSVGCTFYTEEQWHDFAAKYPKAAQYIILSDRSLFEAVGKRARDYIVSYNIDQSETHPSLLKGIEKLLEDGLLSDEPKRKLQSVDVRVVKAANLKICTCYDTVLAALKTYNWHKQNPAVDLIAANDKNEIAALSPEQQEELGRNILQAADGSSRSARTYLSAMRDDQRDWPRSFLKGLLFEVFVNERLEFRFKEIYTSVVLDLLANQKDIEAELAAMIDTSKPKSWISEKSYQDLLDLVKDKPVIIVLAEALERNWEKVTMR